MGSGYQKKKKQAKQLQEQMSRMQSEMESLEVEGAAGGGLVSVTIGGDNSVKKVKIKPECVDPEDVEGLEDLILTALNDANKKLAEKTQGSMPGLGSLGGLSGLF